MKKLAMTAIAAAAVLGAGAAHAYTVGTFSNGFVVPNVVHNGAAQTTAVGIINQTAANVPVFWTFFDQNSRHITDGCFDLTSKDYHPFVWSEQSGEDLENVRGYLVFATGNSNAKCSGTDVAQGASGLIAGNAFYVDTTTSDVSFTPVIDGPLTLDAAGALDLTTLGPDSLVSVAGGAPVVPGTTTLSMRYFIDGKQGGNDTAIVVWSTGDQRGSHTVNIYDDKQNRKSVNFDLQYTELDWFDPENIAGRPANFTDGFIEWKINGATNEFGTALSTGSVFSYSIIAAPAFGALQSVLGAHQ